jgi:hypothetical protein
MNTYFLIKRNAEVFSGFSQNPAEILWESPGQTFRPVLFRDRIEACAMRDLLKKSFNQQNLTVEQL